MPIFLDEEERLSTCELDTKKQQMLHRCTRQMQMVLYGAYNWKSSEETLLDEPANI